MTNTRVVEPSPAGGAGTSVVLATFTVRPPGSLTRALTVSRVLSSECCITDVTMALNTDPSAAPATVPIAPKNDPSTALVAAAPAPAMTLLTVRSRFFGSVAAATAVTPGAMKACAGCVGPAGRPGGIGPVVEPGGYPGGGPVGPYPGAGHPPGAPGAGGWPEPRAAGP